MLTPSGFRRACIAVLMAWNSLYGQTNTDLQKVLDRLDRLESENQKLLEEIRELRTQLTNPPPSTAPAPSVEERLDVEESRTAELAQSKVEASQRMPLSLTGMLLFNAFANGKYSGAALNDPVTANLAPGQRLSGATLRQTVIGLKFNGPDLAGGGKVSGSVYMDFWGGTITPSNNLFRLRIATLNLDWKNTSLVVGQDKPIISPREPESLAQVGLSPLTGAGNLWNWEPQARVEQRFHFGETGGVTAQAGLYQTLETSVNTATGTVAPERYRPGYEGRVEFSFGPENRHFEIAPGYHASDTHIAGASVPSRIFSLDWGLRPARVIDITGAFFDGRNVSGLGSLRQGVTILPTGIAIPVHSSGEWGQIALFPSARGSFHLYGGVENDNPADLAANGITRNFVYAGNYIYKLAPNVLAAIELSQARTSYLTSGLRLNNHYDLALAYLF
jgi:hypothetical protein